MYVQNFNSIEEIDQFLRNHYMSFLLLCKKLQKPSNKKQYNLSSGWVLCLQSHKAVIKVFWVGLSLLIVMV